jgi:hypothetical protein
VLVGFDGVVIDPPVPETMLHDPVPIAGEFPASVVLVRPHIEIPVWSEPAFAVVGFCANVIVISSVDEVHGGLLIVHLKTYVVPAVPVNVLLGLFADAIFPPVPDTMLHDPVPTAGVLAASDVLVSPHIEEPV